MVDLISPLHNTSKMARLSLLQCGFQQQFKKTEEGLKIYNIAQMSQRSPLLFVTFKNSGIKSPKDLHNKKVSIFYGDFAIQPQALFRSLNISPRLLPQSSTPNLFLRGAVDCSDRSIEDITKNIIKDIKVFTEGAPQSDDITILGLDFRGS